jgi:two-component system CheB/CheR fusion protein
MAFPIVAIAASAGGLEALFELVPALPTNCDMAFVVIQHLDPDHKSLLVELLSKKTSMPVFQIEEGQVVRPAHLYIIPPNASVALAGDLFSVTKRDTANFPHHPADTFFCSVADARGDSAIGVVLSGGDGDGTRGVQAIKHVGGITFAQTPASAKFPAMPQHAIDTGCVDFVLPPAEIARELVRLSVHPYLHAEVDQELAADTPDHE